MKPISSPCIGRCELDNNGICKGCFRNEDEIQKWYTASRELKHVLLNNALERKAKRLS